MAGLLLIGIDDLGQVQPSEPTTQVSAPTLELGNTATAASPQSPVLATPPGAQSMDHNVTCDGRIETGTTIIIGKYKHRSSVSPRFSMSDVIIS